MSNIVERVASVIRSDPFDVAEMDKLRAESHALPRGETTDKEMMDCLELLWFKKEHGLFPPEGADIDKWLMDSRERYWAVEDLKSAQGATG